LKLIRREEEKKITFHSSSPLFALRRCLNLNKMGKKNLLLLLFNHHHHNNKKSYDFFFTSLEN
jgi:hypothetical protein